MLREVLSRRARVLDMPRRIGHPAFVLEDDGTPSGVERPVRHWIAFGWIEVHAVWIVGYLLAVSSGTEATFCTSVDRPVQGGGPFGQYGGDYPWSDSWRAPWSGLLAVIALVACVCLTVVTQRFRRTHVRAMMMNFLAAINGVVAIGVLRLVQTDDGKFCSGLSQVVGLSVLAALAAVAGYAVSLWWRSLRPEQ